jgi:apolipoprotein N-acyltransferase
VTTESSASWFPRVLGGVALLLAASVVLDLLFVPRERSEQVFFGIMLSGTTAWMATPIHLIVFLWAAWGCFRRKASMPYVAMGYCVYLIVSLWVWTVLYGVRQQSGPGATLLTVLLSVVLLALCRVIYTHRTAFDQ